MCIKRAGATPLSLRLNRNEGVTMPMRAVLAVVIVCMLGSQVSGFNSNGRGFSASDIMDDGIQNGSFFGNTELNGSGVVIAVADTGIDLDHSCFRNSNDSVGIPGLDHRKIILLNDSIDDWDNSGHQQYRHGTHIAGILVCDPLDGESSMKSFSSGSKLIFQDIVDEEGWKPPPVEELLSEGANNGAVIHSWSWGDDTTNYTNRSSDIDFWTMENPWSLVFVAPGNNGGRMLEPANARNVVAVSASNYEEEGEVWSSSSKGPDDDGRRGILITAPGINVVSAKGDGIIDSMNNESYSMTGTSMAAPMAASFAAVLQQMVEEDTNFTPSGAQLRALLALSGDLVGSGFAQNPDEIQGYGRPNLSLLEDVWTYDSFAMNNWSEFIQSRGNTINELLDNPWDGSGARGPFLSENESFTVKIKPENGSDVVITMSYNSRPQPYQIDDLRLIVRDSEERFALDDNMTSSGYSPMYYASSGSPNTKSSSNETTVMIRIPASELENIDWLEIEVFANNITNGTNQGGVGVNGNRLGFALAATGINENPWEWQDEDNDNVINEIDQCPNTFIGAPVDEEGCAIMNTGPAIVILEKPNNNDNYSDNVSIKWAIEDQEGDDVVVVVRLVSTNLTIDLSDCGKVFTKFLISECVIGIPDDIILYQFNRNDWVFEIVAADSNSSAWTNPMINLISTDNFTIWWNNPLLIEENNTNNTVSNRDNDSSSNNQALLLGIVGVVAGVLFAASVLFRRYEKRYFNSVPKPFVEEE